MSSLPLHETGLPEPRRELDYWIAENVTHERVCHHELDETGKFCKHCHLSKGYVEMDIQPPSFYSTTAAYHQVMEAMTEWYWEFVENPSEL